MVTLTRARQIAQTIAERAAPLGVQAILASAHLAHSRGEAAAIERLRPDLAALFASEDAAEGAQSLIAPSGQVPGPLGPYAAAGTSPGGGGPSGSFT